MALPSSGPISLNQIHVEAGGASGTKASINDSDIRGLIGKASGAKVSFSEFRGVSANIPNATTSGRVKANGVLVDVVASTVVQDTSGSAEAAVEFQMRKITNGFEVRVRHVLVPSADNDGVNPTFYTGSGSSTTLTSSFRRVLVMTGTSLDSYKMDWNIVSGSLDPDNNDRYTDSNQKASDNVFYTGSTRYRVFRVATAVFPGGYESQDVLVDVSFTGRKSGVPDKNFGTYRFSLRAIIESLAGNAF